MWSIIESYLVGTEDFESFWDQANLKNDLIRRLLDSSNSTYCFYNREYGWTKTTNNYFGFFWNDFKFKRESLSKKRYLLKII